MLNNNEKELLLKLKNEPPENLWKIIEEKFNLSLTTYIGNAYLSQRISLHSKSQVYEISKETEKELIKYISFVDIFLKKMEREGYLFIEQATNVKDFNCFIYKERENLKTPIIWRLNELFNQFRENTVFFDCSIDIFINNGFKTEVELNNERTQKLAKTTLIVSIIAILAPIITTTITTIFSYKTYTKERTVTINTSELDKLPIEIINKLEIDRDSIEKIPVEVELTVNHEYPKK